MDENEFVSHLCTPRGRPSQTTTTTNNNNHNHHHYHHHHINDSYYGRKRTKRKRVRSLTRSKSQHDISRRGGGGADHLPAPPGNNPELSVDTRAPGLLKIFGESVVAGTQYKSVLASTRSTAQELIKQALDRYGIASRLYKDYVLCESIGKTLSTDCYYCGEGDCHCHKKNNVHKKSKDKKGGGGGGGGVSSTNNNTISSPSSLSFSSPSGVVAERDLLLLSGNISTSNPNTPRSGARSLHSKTLKKLLNDKSPCGSPRVNCDSPRTPLGSPRTPCGSPSTSRGSPRTSVICNNSNVGKPVQDEFELLNYRPPKVLDSSSFGNPNHHHHHHHQQHQQRLISKSNKNGVIDSPRINNVGLDSPRHLHNVNNVRPSRQDNGGSAAAAAAAAGVQFNDVSRQALGDWIQVYFRVLSYSDRPLELQEFWKPPEGLSRRYELKRRRDVMMDAVENETTGLNDNARKIMISKISPGVIPFSEAQDEKAPEARTVLQDEWNRAASALTNASLTYTDDTDGVLTNIVEGDARQAYICPSIYPYLLTLRGCSIQKDLVLYPLKSRSLSIGSAEKKPQSDDIKLSSQDVNPAHCRVTLKRLPQDEKSVDESKRIYWYCLDLEIFGSSFVTVNGIQARQKATVFPGDLLGIGRQYLFLYKDPTGGHDIPSAVPWLPENETEASAIYSQVIRHQNESREYSRSSLPQSNHQPRSHDLDVLNLDIPYQEEDSNVLDDSAARETAIFLAYHRDKEMELFECIAEVECHSNGDYPLSQALLFLASHQYAARKFSGSHQSTFFKRLVRVVRARVGAVSKLVSQQKRESRVFNTDNSSTKLSSSASSEVDYFPCLVNWLSTVLTLLSHCGTSQFQTYVSSIARRNDVIKSVQEAVGYFEETVSFLFQQVVYSVTKVLYDPINKFMQGAIPDNPKPSNQALRRILEILQAVRRLVLDLLVDAEVANQLMVYLLFFVSTTLFNRIIAKGSKLYNRDSGVVLQEGVGALEGWSKEAGLEHEFVRVSEHVLSLVDLLSSSKRSLLRLDWSSFQTQFSPLTDVQLCKILGEYDLGEGVSAPDSWHPSHPVDHKQGELTVSLSSHPPFVLPTRGEQVNLQDTFPSAFYRHLELVQQRFSLLGEDAYYSGLSSAGNTPRLSDSINRSTNLDTFFTTQDPNASISGSSLYLKHFQSDPKPQVIPIKTHIESSNGNDNNSNDNNDAQNPNHHHQHLPNHHHHHHQQQQQQQQHHNHNPPPHNNNNQQHTSSSSSSSKRIPPQTAPKPKRGQYTTQENQSKQSSYSSSTTTTTTTTNHNRAIAPPPYNMAIKLKHAQSQDNPSTNAPPNTIDNINDNDEKMNNKINASKPHHQISRSKPVIHYQPSTDQQTFTEPKPKTKTTKTNIAIQLSNSHLQKFQTLPDNIKIKDKLFSSPNNNNSTSQLPHSASSQSHSHRNKSGKPVSSHRTLKTQQSWTPSSSSSQQTSTDPHQHNHLMNESDLSSTYPGTRPRPSSATDMQYSSPEHSSNTDNNAADPCSNPFMSHHQRAELLSTRSNSALGYDMMKTNHHPHSSHGSGNDANYDSSSKHLNLQPRQYNSVQPDSPSNYSPGRSRNQLKDRRENMLNPSPINYDRRVVNKDSSSTLTHNTTTSTITTQHVSPYNYTPHHAVENPTTTITNNNNTNNNTITLRQENNDIISSSKNNNNNNHSNDDINSEGLFAYGSLKRSPRNTNLSKRTSSDDRKLNETTTTTTTTAAAAAAATTISFDKTRGALTKPRNNFTSDNHNDCNSDVPPPLPPRGENTRIRRQPSVESQPPQRDSSRERTNRESPLGSTTSSSGQRPRCGSRTSVEIQDITENQYIIYNPDSPVKEFFDFNQNYLSMVNRNNPDHSKSTQGAITHSHYNHHPHHQQQQPQHQQEPTRKLTRVPRLELPDDLLGVSENDSQDEVFASYFGGSSDSIHRASSSTTTAATKTKTNQPRRISSVDDYPDDVYIDVNDLSNSDSTASSTLKVLPVSDEGRRTNNDPSNGLVFVRYRHSMPEASSSHDVTTNQQGEITGEVFTVTLTKTGNKLGMGLIDGLHTPLKLAGIYVRNVLPDTPAALCGCLRVGDMILSVNDINIVGMDYNSAMKLIHNTGPKLELTVVKGNRTIASKISASTA